MEKRFILQITNVNKLNNLKKEATFEECLKLLLAQNFKLH